VRQISEQWALSQKVKDWKGKTSYHEGKTKRGKGPFSPAQPLLGKKKEREKKKGCIGTGKV